MSSRLFQIVNLYTTGKLANSHSEISQQIGMAPSGAGSLSFTSDNKIIIEARMNDTSDKAVSNLKENGATILNISSQYMTITIAVSPENLQKVANTPEVINLQEVISPST
jgi:hypothetical protein